MVAVTKISRPLDQRRRNSPFAQAVGANVRRGRFSMAIVTEAVKSRRFQTYDSPAGVLVVTGLSDLPQYRAQVERILGKGIRVVYADNFGTVYQGGFA